MQKFVKSQKWVWLLSEMRRKVGENQELSESVSPFIMSDSCVCVQLCNSVDSSLPGSSVSPIL